MMACTRKLCSGKAPLLDPTLEKCRVSSARIGITAGPMVLNAHPRAKGNVPYGAVTSTPPLFTAKRAHFYFILDVVLFCFIFTVSLVALVALVAPSSILRALFGWLG